MTVAVLFTSALAVISSGKGFAPAAAKKAAAPPVPAATSSKPFVKWAEENDVKVNGIGISEFDGERGVTAASTVDAGAAVLTVPSRLAVQTNTLSKNPKWCDEASWKSCKWDARLAMLPSHRRCPGCRWTS